MAFTREIEINAPITYVFEKSTDFKAASSIMDSVVRTEILTEGPVQKGTRIKEVRLMRGKEVETVLTVTDFNKDQHYSVKSEDNGITVEYHYSFKKTAQGTHVHFEGFADVAGIKKFLLKPFIEMMLKKEDGDHLEKLKSYIERGYTAV
ncbi:SRPBCC family protein [Jeotgalibacillus malaysiensis]|uniref:SRPBCC family protein n=1 Tax=Jeotgalibacillus malaysiensis TaxID=1508404 RepID=UPI0038514FA7